jgi:VIT1/CCC1 family predicted Fe2+/Mn2+ transporter
MAVYDSWHEEMQSAWLYRVLAGVETDGGKRALFSALATAAEDQARIWERQMAEDGEPPPPRFIPSRRAHVVAAILRRLGPRAIRPVLAAMKVRGISVYGAAMPGHPMPTAVEQVGGRHRGVGSGGNLRAAVFGVNDGLVSNTALIMGVAGATADTAFILTSGVAGLLAGALSMAAGEYISMRSQREMFEYQIGLEREELAEYPAEETEELALIYHARGVPLARARELAAALMQNPEHALDTLAREELGLNPDDLGSPWGAAASSFAAFTAGAVLPLLPFLLPLGTSPLPTAASLAVLGLFAVGATLSLFTGRGALRSGLRMVLIGGGAGGVTYLIGMLLGVSLA